MDGFAYAGEALSGKYVGARNEKLLRRTVRQIFMWGAGLSLFFVVLYVVGGEPFLSLLTDDKTVIVAADGYFYWALLIPIVGFAAFMWDGIYIGATATRGMLISMFIASFDFFCYLFWRTCCIRESRFVAGVYSLSVFPGNRADGFIAEGFAFEKIKSPFLSLCL